MNGKLVCLIQARVNSTRLPNKVLFDLAGKSMLERVVDRVFGASGYFDEFAVATGNISSNDIIEDICNYNGWGCLRGSEDDVLARYYHIAKSLQAGSIIRVCADDPFLDPNLLVKTVVEFYNNKVDYAATETLVLSFPIGLAIEVMTMNILEEAYFNTAVGDREHVTPYIWRNKDKFKTLAITNSKDLSHIRLTVDTMEDYKKARRLYCKFGNGYFTWEDIVRDIERNANGNN